MENNARKCNEVLTVVQHGFRNFASKGENSGTVPSDFKLDSIAHLKSTGAIVDGEKVDAMACVFNLINVLKLITVDVAILLHDAYGECSDNWLERAMETTGFDRRTVFRYRHVGQMIREQGADFYAKAKVIDILKLDIIAALPAVAQREVVLAGVYDVGSMSRDAVRALVARLLGRDFEGKANKAEKQGAFDALLDGLLAYPYTDAESHALVAQLAPEKLLDASLRVLDVFSVAVMAKRVPSGVDYKQLAAQFREMALLVDQL